MIILYGGELIHISNQQASIGIQAQSNVCSNAIKCHMMMTNRHTNTIAFNKNSFHLFIYHQKISTKSTARPKSTYQVNVNVSARIQYLTKQCAQQQQQHQINNNHNHIITFYEIYVIFFLLCSTVKYQYRN